MGHRRRSLLALALALACCSCSGEGARSGAAAGGLGAEANVETVQEPADRPEDEARIAAADAAARRMIGPALDFLATRQNDDGSFGGEDTRSIRLGLSAVATLAFLADGHHEGRGRHHATVARAVRFLRSCSTRSGPRRGYFQAPGDDLSRMHGHGLATLALTQAHGTFGVKRRFAEGADDVAATLAAAIGVILDAQSLAGGWHYEPEDREQDEGSITVCMIQALRGARNCGFEIPAAAIDRALRYVRASQAPDGRIRYALRDASRTSYELTAAGAATLLHGGRPFDSAFRSARAALWRPGELEAFLDGRHAFPYYGVFHVAQVLQLDQDESAGRRRARHLPAVVAWIESGFDAESGAIRQVGVHHSERSYGDVYSTAFAAAALLVRAGQLPIFQR